jgi:hypothetical protein
MGLRFVLTGFAWLLITSESLWNWGFITGIEWELWDQRVIDQGPIITILGCPIKGPEYGYTHSDTTGFSDELVLASSCLCVATVHISICRVGALEAKHL